MTAAEPAGTTPGVEKSDRGQALVRLRERYDEAREHGSSEEGHANLEWILGARRNPEQRPADLDGKMISIVALWLGDLAHELDRRPAPEPDRANGEAALREYQTRQTVAASLRVAAEGFLVAFGPSVPTR